MPANEVTVSVKIRTVNDDLAEAQKNSKAVFDKLLNDLAPLGVKPENVQLQDHELGKEFEDGPDGQRLWKGFYSSRSFKVVLGDVEKLELVHAELAENPDLELNGTSYSRTDQIKIRKKLREDALEAAREKARLEAEQKAKEEWIRIRLFVQHHYKKHWCESRRRGISSRKGDSFGHRFRGVRIDRLIP